jgi:polar amino acid transport system substrate-binding protein
MSSLYCGLPAVVITGCLLFVAGCVSTGQQPPLAGYGSPASIVTTVPALPPPGTPMMDREENFSRSDQESLVSFVKSAVDYATMNGRDKAIAEFNNHNGLFSRGDLYVFAYDYNGTVIALPFQKELLGTNRMENMDPDGVQYVRDIGEMARKGGGFVEYRYPDPSRNFSIERKMSYALDVDGTWYVGSGYYI